MEAKARREENSLELLENRASDGGLMRTKMLEHEQAATLTESPRTKAENPERGETCKKSFMRTMLDDHMREQAAGMPL